MANKQVQKKVNGTFTISRELEDKMKRLMFHLQKCTDHQESLNSNVSSAHLKRCFNFAQGYNTNPSELYQNVTTYMGNHIG